MDDKHQDLIDDHWTAVCHHAHTVMFDESSFDFLPGERVRSLTHESSTEAWELAGFRVEGDHPGAGNYARLEDRAKR